MVTHLSSLHVRLGQINNIGFYVSLHQIFPGFKWILNTQGIFASLVCAITFTTIALNELLLLHFCSHTKRGEFLLSNTLFYLMEIHQFLRKLFQISFSYLYIKPYHLLKILERCHSKRETNQWNSRESKGLCYAKMSPMVWVVVIPKWYWYDVVIPKWYWYDNDFSKKKKKI